MDRLYEPGVEMKDYSRLLRYAGIAKLHPYDSAMRPNTSRDVWLHIYKEPLWQDFRVAI